MVRDDGKGVGNDRTRKKKSNGKETKTTREKKITENGNEKEKCPKFHMIKMIMVKNGM